VSERYCSLSYFWWIGWEFLFPEAGIAFLCENEINKILLKNPNWFNERWKSKLVRHSWLFLREKIRFRILKLPNSLSIHFLSCFVRFLKNKYLLKKSDFFFFQFPIVLIFEEFPKFFSPNFIIFLKDFIPKILTQSQWIYFQSRKLSFLKIKQFSWNRSLNFSFSWNSFRNLNWFIHLIKELFSWKQILEDGIWTQEDLMKNLGTIFENNWSVIWKLSSISFSKQPEMISFFQNFWKKKIHPVK